MDALKRINATIIIVAITAVISACGYGIRPEPEVSSLEMGDFDNRTHEPGFSDNLRELLAFELASRGITVDHGSENVLSGRLERLEINPLAEKGGTIVKFSVRIFAEFSIRRGRSSEPKAVAVPLSYIVAFGSDVALDDLYALREEALQRALADLAVDLAEAVATIR